MFEFLKLFIFLQYLTHKCLRSKLQFFPFFLFRNFILFSKLIFNFPGIYLPSFKSTKHLFNRFSFLISIEISVSKFIFKSLKTFLGIITSIEFPHLLCFVLISI